MKISREKKIAVISLCVFLGFMAVCTIVAKGIYRSGLPKVSTQKPYSTSLTHTLQVTGRVQQGQEYGLFVESGLRVATITVRTGDRFEEGQRLFQVDTEDLRALIGQQQLALDKLEGQRREEWQAASLAQQEWETEAVRAREDYNYVLAEADALIAQRERALEEARWELALYDQYLYDLSMAESSVSGGDAQTEAAWQYERQNRRYQLAEAAEAAAEALEAARRQKERELVTACNAIEDAECAAGNVAPLGSIALDIAYQEEQLARLEELLEAEGWITAQAAGQILEIHLSVGGRTGDDAAMVYALDEGERVIEADFVASVANYIDIGTELSMEARLSDGTRLKENVLVSYTEQSVLGKLVRIVVEEEGLSIGQSVSLRGRAQTENYGTCVPLSCLQEGETEGSYYVYVAEEQEGILGTEWKVRRVSVSVEDRTDTVVAIASPEISTETRIVSGHTGTLTDGMIVRVVN